MYDVMDTTWEQSSVRLLGLMFTAPVAAYVLITPASISYNATAQILRTIITVLVSAAILIVTTGSDWHVSQAVVRTQYSAFSNRKVEGKLIVGIGLNSATVQLYGSVPDLPMNSVNYNEKFSWNRAGDMKKNYKDALVRGLPYPILTAVEYLSLDDKGFHWGRHYRQAGYYTYYCLWSAFTLWLLSNVLWSFDAIYGTAALVSTGATLLLTNAIYTFNLSTQSLVIPYDGKLLEFAYGWCYYLTAAVGLLCLLMGGSTILVRYLSASKHVEYSDTLEDPCFRTWKNCFSKYSRLYESKARDMYCAR